jgi:hypothetical protein
VHRGAGTSLITLRSFTDTNMRIGRLAIPQRQLEYPMLPLVAMSLAGWWRMVKAPNWPNN